MVKKRFNRSFIRQSKKVKGDQWEVVEFPAILETDDEKKPVWPQYWKMNELESVKATLPVGKWNAQWMQEPTSEEGALIKREWWQKWDKEFLPDVTYIIQSYDTAFLKKETADYSAITTWGIFYPEEGGKPNLILLDAIKERFEFPELRREAS